MLIGKLKRLFLFILVIAPNLLLLSACSETEIDPDAEIPIPKKTYNLTVNMTAEQVVSASDSTHTATATIFADERYDTITISVDASKFSDVEAVSLHTGFAGTNSALSKSLELSDDLDVWVLSDELNDFTESQFTALFDGRLYLELTSTSYPDGAVRGQLMTENLDLAIFNINGKSLVPEKTSTLTGIGYATADSDKSTVTIYAHISDTDVIESSYLFQGSVSENGSPLQGSEFSEADTDPKLWLLKAYEMEPDEFSAMKDGDVYISMHSSDSSDVAAEIRGQLSF